MDEDTQFDQGFELFKREPELLLIEVWRKTMTLSRPEAEAFVAGYTAARAKRDAYEQERQT